MSELRHDPFRRRWVIIATERGNRPSDWSFSVEPRESRFCPFCPGNEDKTPPEIAAVRESDAPANSTGWQVRVIPNKFPALSPDGALERRAEGIYDAVEAIGAHEVIIETPDHFAHFSELSHEQIHLVLKAWRDSIKRLEEDSRFKYVMLFKNYGSQAGATLAHPHTQLIAMPVVPRTVADEMTHAQEYFAEKERNILNDIVHQELQQGQRIIVDNPDFTVLTPYASRFPYEMLVVPRHQQHSFSLATDDELEHLAKVLKETLTRLKVGLGDPPFNLVLHTSPNLNVTPRKPGAWATIEYDWRWHLEIIPRLTHVAGFEWGTGFFINPTPPEEAARVLREVTYP